MTQFDSTVETAARPKNPENLGKYADVDVLTGGHVLVRLDSSAVANDEERNPLLRVLDGLKGRAIIVDAQDSPLFRSLVQGKLVGLVKLAPDGACCGFIASHPAIRKEVAGLFNLSEDRIKIFESLHQAQQELDFPFTVDVPATADCRSELQQKLDDHVLEKERREAKEEARCMAVATSEGRTRESAAVPVSIDMKEIGDAAVVYFRGGKLGTGIHDAVLEAIDGATAKKVVLEFSGAADFEKNKAVVVVKLKKALAALGMSLVICDNRYTPGEKAEKMDGVARRIAELRLHKVVPMVNMLDDALDDASE